MEAGKAVSALESQKLKYQRKQTLWTERENWVGHWRDISEVMQPRAGRFLVSDVNKLKKPNRILDNTALFAARALPAGMMSGMTSPARPWFRMEIADKDLMKSKRVKQWLYDVRAVMLAIFAKSNTYRTLQTMYGELGLFGTAASAVLPNFHSVIHHYPMTIGEYAIATNELGAVDTLVRDFKMTSGQMVKQFGRDNCSAAVRNLVDQGNYDAWVPVIHMISPRGDRDYAKLDSKNMPFSGCYFEPGGDSNRPYLQESGFKKFRALCPRWNVTGNDIYGTSPGMDCLGDVQQLQQQQLRKGQAIDYQVHPPLIVPTKLKDMAKSSRQPGGFFYDDAPGQNSVIRSAYEVNLDLGSLREDIEDVRGRIRTAFYADLFLMLANDTRSGTTATEIAERHEEKLLMLGPVLERLHNELLTPLIEMTFDQMEEAGMFRPMNIYGEPNPLAPPPELDGMDIGVEFISVLAQAQRAVAAGGVDRLIATIGTIAAAYPGAVDKVNFDVAIDDYADMFGVNPAIMVPTEEANAIREQRAQQMAMQQAAAAAPVMADTAKTASEIDAGNMQDVMNLFSGYNSPSSTEIAAA